MDPKVQFFFYLAAVVCFGLAALAPKTLSATGVGLVPLGLALFVFPTLWNVGEVAF